MVPLITEVVAKGLLGKSRVDGHSLALHLAASGGKQRQRRSGRRHRRGRYRVVARRFQQRQSRSPQPAAIGQHVRHRRMAALLHRAQRFFLQRDDATRDIAGAGISEIGSPWSRK